MSTCQQSLVRRDMPFTPHISPSTFKPRYTVGVFGKHLNNENTPTAPPGVLWFVNGGGDYLPLHSWDGTAIGLVQELHAERADGACYSTSVIGTSALDGSLTRVAAKA